MRPRTAIATPRVAGRRLRPPVKAKGRDCVLWDWEIGSEESKRGVERKMTH